MPSPATPGTPGSPVAPEPLTVEFASRAVRAVREVAATEILPRFRAVTAQRKDDGSLVTEADLAAQHALAIALARIEPVAVLGEEMEDAEQRRIWDSGGPLLVHRPARRHRELQRRRALLRRLRRPDAGRPPRVRRRGRPHRRRGLLRRARRGRLARRVPAAAACGGDRPRAGRGGGRPAPHPSRTSATSSSTGRRSPGASPAAPPRSRGATSPRAGATSCCTPGRRCGTTPPAPSSRKRRAARIATLVEDDFWSGPAWERLAIAARTPALFEEWKRVGA